MATVAVVDDVQGDHGTCMQVQMLGSKCEIGEMNVYFIRVRSMRRSSGGQKPSDTGDRENRGLTPQVRIPRRLCDFPSGTNCYRFALCVVRAVLGLGISPSSVAISSIILRNRGFRSSEPMQYIIRTSSLKSSHLMS